ncbi:MAG: efflux RND transporter periplasmic adaptor subunit [Bradyrhizobium sp.]|uniref:efflux RND transporter periplasmic adaptor subunit n=1 Tax=Bradyrhizobium sp. TaxID=376 RepID=UPI00272FF3D2|nr:efflux RND transporter periplasmic adaptor subunit [Bradyrhizobium sp.]MDP1865733.1 efflux RND transporter periplasmic adaptor subunit [Bradyrhizobium sp.]
MTARRGRQTEEDACRRVKDSANSALRDELDPNQQSRSGRALAFAFADNGIIHPEPWRHEQAARPRRTRKRGSVATGVASVSRAPGRGTAGAATICDPALDHRRHCGAAACRGRRHLVVGRQQRQAVLDAAQVNLEYTKIISPVDGTVVSRNVTIGQTVAASFQTPTLFLIATDLTKMQVDANVSESDIGGVRQGNKATFTVDAYPRRVFEGTVSQVRQSPQTVQNVVTYDVVVSVQNSDLALKPGLTAATRILTDQRSDVLRVPNQALRYVPTGNAARETAQPCIFVLRDGKATPIQVATGLDDDEFTEIAQGDLEPGDNVILGEAPSAAKGRASVPRPRL